MRRFILLLLLCGWAVPVVLADGPAGIVLYFRAGGETYLLLADHSKGVDEARGWAGFGGSAKDGESAAQTAARETEEETNGYFRRDWLLERLGKQLPIVDGVFSCFFLEVDFVPIPRIANHRRPSQERDYFERGPFAWIPYSQVTGYLGAAPVDAPETKPIIASDYLPSGRQTDWLWSIWLNNLRTARTKGPLPWEISAGPAKELTNPSEAGRR